MGRGIAGEGLRRTAGGSGPDLPHVKSSWRPASRSMPWPVSKKRCGWDCPRPRPTKSGSSSTATRRRPRRRATRCHRTADAGAAGRVRSDTAPPEIKRRAPRRISNSASGSSAARSPTWPSTRNTTRSAGSVRPSTIKRPRSARNAANPSSPRPAVRQGRRAEGGRPCFIATAACGHEAAPEVRILRAFRDGCLERSAAGRALTAVYERCSPPAARWIAARPAWQRRVRRWLVRPLARAAARRLTDRPEED